MRRRISVAAAAVIAALLAACSDRSLPTAPVSGSALKLTINADGCVDTRLQLATIDPQIKGLIANLFKDLNHASSTQTMWENMKKDKLDGKPLLNHIDNLTKWTLEHLSTNTLNDPDGPSGILNATTGTVRLLDLVFRCAGQTPTTVPSVPAGFDAIFQLVAPSTGDQQFNTSFDDAAAFIPGDALEGSTLLVLARQPEEINVNTPFPKLSRTVDVALAGGKIKPGQNLSVLFCPVETIDHDINPRLVVAHQKTAVEPTAPVGEGVEYLPPNEGGTLDCPHGIAFNPQMEKNVLKRGVMHLASFAGKAWSFIGPKNAWAAHAAIGGLISFDAGDESSLSPMVLVDPFVETGITDVSIPTTTYGETVSFSATLRVTNVPAACAPTPTAAVCGWVGQPVTAALPGMPALTLANLKISATLDGQTQEDAIDASGKADFSFTHLNAADAPQTASLAFAHTINHPANAPDFAPSSVTASYTVNRRALTVAADANEWEYGTPEPVTGTFSSSAVQYGEDVTPSYTTTQNALTEVGTYDDALVADVVFGPGVRPENYAVTKTDATLTVVKAPLDVTANNKSRQYGDANPALDVTVVGLKNDDALTPTLSTAATPASSVAGSPYAITLSAVTGPRLERNYNITLHDGQLTVTPRPLTVTVGSPTIVYGDEIALSATNDALFGDVITYDFTTTPTGVPNVGTYTIGATVSGASPNYAPVTVNTGTLTINKRSITISVANASRDDGAANPDFTGTIGGAGLLGTDGVGVDYVTTATVASPPGDYPINAVLTGSASTNYDAMITPGTLTVNAVTPPVLEVDNDFPTVSTTAGCGGTGSLFQSFTTSSTSLKAVDLRFRTGGSFPPGGTTTTINVRQGSPTGTIVGTATATVTGNGVTTFTFASPLAVTANATYVIEWVTLHDSIISWAETDSDTYAGGTAFGCGATAIADKDYYFRTYR